MPLALQPVLLRALEEGVIYRLGGTQPRHVNVRLLALTNRNLLEEVDAGRFPARSLSRISVTRLRIPPLRERDADIELLAARFNRQLTTARGGRKEIQCPGHGVVKDVPLAGQTFAS